MRGSWNSHRRTRDSFSITANEPSPDPVSLDRSPAAAANRRPSTDADDHRALECREVLASCWDYLDGTCAPALALRLDGHFSRCVTCSGVREFQTRFLASLAAMRSRSLAPARLHERVRRALVAERGQYRLQ